jgi:hypothetical protein
MISKKSIINKQSYSFCFPVFKGGWVGAVDECRGFGVCFCIRAGKENL